MNRTRMQFAVVFVILVITVLVLLRPSRPDLHEIETQSWRQSRSKVSASKVSTLNVVRPEQFANEMDFKCVDGRVANLTFPMCLYDAKDDVFISSIVLKGSYYEPELVEKFVKFLRAHPDVTFLDLGANLGTYTLPVAHSGGHVVAVEPNRDTARRLAKSVYLGLLGHGVDLLGYAISSEESTTFMKVDATNRGDTFIAGNASCSGCLSAQTTTLNKLIPFIKNGKAIMKVDVQEAEIKVFTRAGAGQFFSEVDVLMIQMEWHMYPARFGKTENDRRRVDRFLEFFYQRGYVAYNPRTEKKLPPEWTSWPFDIMLKKEGLPTDSLFYS